MRRADHSSRGVLPSVVCMSMIVNSLRRGDRGPRGLVEPWGREEGSKR